MASIQELRERLDGLAEIEEPLERRLRTLAIITECLAPTGIKPVLVGGMAVEFYTSGGYSTFDIDVIADTQSLGRALDDLGFSRHGRHWFREDLSVAIEAPSDSLGAEAERIAEVKMGDLRFYVLGVEDLILDRLNAYVHWKSDEDRRWATHLIAENRDQIDWDYLNRRAEEDGVRGPLDEIVGQI